MSMMELSAGENSEPPSGTPTRGFQAAWPWILCVVGLDYLSSLAYQPSIAYQAAGPLAPLVTLVLEFVTLFAAVPLYNYMARRSPHGHGVIGLLERILPGWRGKMLILILLGFGATDLVLTRTFSAADAAEHIIHSPHPAWQQTLEHWTNKSRELHPHLPEFIAPKAEKLWSRHLVVTLFVLFVGLGVSLLFGKGFTPWLIRLAVLTVFVYFVLNVFLIGSGVVYLFAHGELVSQWWTDVRSTPMVFTSSFDVWSLVGTCFMLFPALALGLSGFEMTMLLMPYVRGRKDDDPNNPEGRIVATRKLLWTAGGIMSVMLIASAFVTTMLIPRES